MTSLTTKKNDMKASLFKILSEFENYNPEVYVESIDLQHVCQLGTQHKTLGNLSVKITLQEA